MGIRTSQRLAWFEGDGSRRDAKPGFALPGFWTWSRVKFIDYIIMAAILGCLFLAYAGFRIEAALLLGVVVIVASWRFWDRSREKHLMRGASSDNCPDHPDSVAAGGHDSSDTGNGGGDD